MAQHLRLQQLLSQLNSLNTSQVADTLPQLKLLINNDQSLKSQARSKQSLTSLFQLLLNSDDVIKSLSCAVLQLLLDGVRLSELQSIEPNILTMILDGLFVESAVIQSLSLNLLQQYANQVDDARILLQLGVPLVIKLLDSLSTLSVRNCSLLNSVCSSLCQYAEGASAIKSDEIVSKLKGIVESDDSILAFRAYELIVQLAVKHSSLISTFSQHIQSLMSKINNQEDVLSQLNALEVLTQFCASSDGKQMIQDSGIVDQVFRILSPQNQHSANDQLILSNVVKFVGRYLHNNFPTMVEYQQTNGFLTQIAQYMKSDDIEQVDSAIYAVGLLGFSAESLLLLEQSGLCKDLIKCYNISGKVERTFVLRALANIWSQYDFNPPAEFSQLCHERLYLRIQSQKHPLQEFQEYFCNPDEQISFAVCSAMKAMSLHGWGLREFVQYDAGGFFGYFLLKRLDNLSYEQCVSKLELVECVLKSTECHRDIVPQSIVAQLRQYINQGPVFKTAQASVAFEGSN
ncbi:hypothetical protein MP228_008495 [Amoeboaphelidium protococcarum]|nr:hypothetical protein MP228_008495 [Amoeboaphelidium protococcarum]